MHEDLIEKVAAAFSREDLKRVCEMDEETFGQVYDLTAWEAKWVKHADNYFFYADRGSDILAVAHLDTVTDRDRRMCDFAETAVGTVVHSGCLDDRLGAYIILDLLPKLGLQFDILLTVGEESGRSTAQYFKPETVAPEGTDPKEYNWVIEFDRGGSDVVMYCYDDMETKSLVRKCGATPGHGSISDITYLEHLEVKCFNWGTGYKDYHGPKGYAYLNDTFQMVAYFLQFHADNGENYLPHEKKKWGYSPSSSHGFGSGRNSHGGSYGAPYEGSYGGYYGEYGEYSGLGGGEDPPPKDKQTTPPPRGKQTTPPKGPGKKPVGAAPGPLAADSYAAGGTTCDACQAKESVDTDTGWCWVCETCNDCWYEWKTCACQSNQKLIAALLLEEEHEPLPLALEPPATPPALDPPAPPHIFSHAKG